MPKMNLKGVALVGALTLWLAVILSGASVMLSYAMLSGGDADPVTRWPTSSQFERRRDCHTLLLFAHPFCPCSRATLEQIQHVLLAARTTVDCRIIFVLPSGLPGDAADASLVQQAKQVPGVSVSFDRSGVEAAQFAIRTSGHVLLYDSDGLLQFSGGITGSRGHVGDCQGTQTLIELLNGMNPLERRTPVFGCPLFESSIDCTESQTCNQ